MQTFESSRDVYEVIRQLGSGGMGTAYLVKSRQTGEQYCLKQLRLDRAGDWKSVELFEREAKVLAQLSHPHIPAYVDYFKTGESGTDFALVQAFIEGETLQQHIEQKKPVSLDAFTSYFKQSLEILVYLHSLIPPVVHRDITPKNLIIAPPSPQWRGVGGEVYVVDFGSVKVALGPSTSMTTVGTFGYMAPEHLIGQAEPVSDLYSLGMSLIALASLTDPSRMPLDKTTGRVDVASLVSFLPSHMRMLLQDMVRPGVGERVPSAKAALDRLLNPTSTLQVQYSGQAQTPPKTNPSTIKKSGKGLKIFGVIAGLLFTVLLLGWLSTLQRARGEVRTLGGWFTGHSHLLSAMTGTLTGDYSLISRRAWVTAVAYGANNKIASSANKTVLLWDTNTGAVLKEYEVEVDYSSHSLAFTPDGKWLAVASKDKVYLFDTESDAGPTMFDLETILYQQLKADYIDVLDMAAVSPEKIIVAYSYKGQTVIVNAAARAALTKITHPEVYLSKPAVLSDNGEGFALAVEQEVLFWQVNAAPEQSEASAKRRLRSHDKIITVALSEDASLLAALTDISGIIWDVTSGTTKQDFPARMSGYSFEPHTMSFSANSKLLSVGHGQEVYFFGVESGARLERYEAHRDEIKALAFAPDGESVVTIAADQLLKIWKSPAVK